jgi:hypothetical protein
MRERARTDMVIDALVVAIGRRRPDRDVAHHSDRESVHTSLRFANHLEDLGLVASVASLMDPGKLSCEGRPDASIAALSHSSFMLSTSGVPWWRYSNIEAVSDVLAFRLQISWVRDTNSGFRCWLERLDHLTQPGIPFSVSDRCSQLCV